MVEILCDVIRQLQLADLPDSSFAELDFETFEPREDKIATIKQMTRLQKVRLFDCSTDNIGLHLKNIFASGELEKDSVTEKISATASDGKNYMTRFYNLDAVISVGYRVNSIRATQFRQWATNVLREFAIRGYVLDKKRMARSLAKIILSICWLRLGRFDYQNVDSTKN